MGQQSDQTSNWVMAYGLLAFLAIVITITALITHRCDQKHSPPAIANASSTATSDTTVTQQILPSNTTTAPTVVADTTVSTTTPATASATEKPTVSPTPVAPSETPANSVLQLHGTWYQGNESLTLTVADIRGNGVYISFRFTNNKSQRISTKFTLDNISAVNNAGVQLKVIPVAGAFGEQGDLPCSVILDPGQSIDLPNFGCGERDTLYVACDTSVNSLHQVVISVSLSEIHNAQWSVSIAH